MSPWLAWAVVALVFGVPLLGLSALGAWTLGSWVRFALYHRHKGLEHVDGPSWSARLEAWANESVGIAKLAWWNVHRVRSPSPREAEQPPVLCVHGFTQNRSNFVGIIKRLRAVGREAVSIDLGRMGRHPASYSKPFERALDHLAEHYPSHRFDVVCHSMGGVVLRHILRERPDLVDRVRTVVTLGTPHHGTGSTRGLKLLPEARGMHRRSRWLGGLPSLVELLPHARIVTVGATADYVVYPLETCHLDGAECVVVQGTGHGGLLSHRQVYDLVQDVVCAEVIAQEDADTPAP